MEREGQDRPDRFDQRLEQARHRAGLDPLPPTDADGTGSRDPHPLTFAFRLGVEMVASLAVACAIGYGLDRWLGTKPWLMVAFVPIGVAAGVMNLMRSVAPSGPPGAAGKARERGGRTR